MQQNSIAGASIAPGTVALTPAQWLSWDVRGYVLLENVLSADEVARAKTALYRLPAEEDLGALRVYVNRRNDHQFHAGHLLEYDPALLEYAVNPTLVSFAEQVMGGTVRVQETEGIVNSRDPHGPPVASGEHGAPLGFHTATRHGWGIFYDGHHFHCLFVKTLAYLSDVGSDDGGTAVIPGSHRLTWPEHEIIHAARTDPSLVHQVEARAGSVLLFPESLVHSTTAVHSEAERVVLITGYSATLIREWPGNEVTPSFVDTLPDREQTLLTGGDGWSWWVRRGKEQLTG